MKADFVSVKDYQLSYGHDGLHIKVIRTRFDYKDIKNVKFYVLEINLFEGKMETYSVTDSEVQELFEKYYPELPKRIVKEFMNGLI